MRKAKEFFYIAGMVGFWSVYYICSKWMVDYSGSAFLAGFLLRAAAFVFLTIYMHIRHDLRLVLKQGKIAILLLLVGVFGYLLDTFANLGFQGGSVSTGTALLKLDVLMVNIVSAIFLKDKLFRSDWLGTIVMLGGVLMVLNIDFKDMSLNWYDMFFIASAVAVVINAFLIKGIQHKYHTNSDVIGYYNNFVVMILFLISALIAGDFSVLQGSNPSALFYVIIVLGGIGQGCIYIFYYRNLLHYPVWKVKLFMLFMPIITCFIGIFAFGEQVVGVQFGGIGLILVGAVIILLREKMNKKNILKSILGKRLMEEKYEIINTK